MNINYIVLGLMATAIFLHVSNAFLIQDKPPPSDLPWVPIQVGKSRSFHSQTRDAGLYTESTRRQAIIRNPDPVYGYKGSTNGSMEWNFLTGVCVCPPRPCKTIYTEIADGGDAEADACIVFDANGTDVIDLGDAETTNIC